MKIKRILAYFIDIFIVTIISSLLFMLPGFKDSYTTYNNYYNDYVDELMNSGSGDYDVDKLDDFQYNISKASMPLMIIRVGVLIIYFGVVGFILNGQTIGKKLLHLRVKAVEGNLNPGLFMLREALVTGFFFEVLSLILLSTLSKGAFLIASTYISYANFFVYFLIIGFLIFRDDERGFHDIICKTQVISTKEWWIPFFICLFVI